MFIREIYAKKRILGNVILRQLSEHLSNAAIKMISQLSERLSRRILVGTLKDRLHRYGDRLTFDNRNE